MNNPAKIILASSSAYRAELLSRLLDHFEQIAPQIDESRGHNEPAESYVQRLSLEKAKVIASANPDAWVIGSDQIAVFGDELLGKPGSFDQAVAQLKQQSGKTLIFMTGVCLTHYASQQTFYQLDKVKVKFKQLSDEMIRQYLQIDQPFDCAGSFKIESKGVILFDRVVSDDPTSLQGLPLIKLCQLFDQANLDLLSDL